MQQALLNTVLNTDTLFLPENIPLGKIATPFNMEVASTHPFLMIQQQAVNVSQANLRVERLSLMPNFSGRFYSQSLYGLNNPYSGFSVSVGIPLFGVGNYRNKIRAAKLERDYQQTLYDYESQSFDAQVQQVLQALDKSRQMLQYYETTGLEQARQIIKAANLSYRGGEIGFAELSQYLNQALDIQKDYLDALHQYNQNAIQLNYFLNR